MSPMWTVRISLLNLLGPDFPSLGICIPSHSLIEKMWGVPCVWLTNKERTAIPGEHINEINWDLLFLKSHLFAEARKKMLQVSLIGRLGCISGLWFSYSLVCWTSVYWKLTICWVPGWILKMGKWTKEKRSLPSQTLPTLEIKIAGEFS